ncbi:MAG: hypothetical protein IJ779_11250, partial [Ruminococcus sp.]|nr:hypothetical protein [Ruminococcus sp.]
TTYGIPTEEGSGMASWYDNPAGKDTAIYLFNLEEGVQVSIYATADSPDRSYEKEITVPAPEIRTPIVPIDTAAQRSSDENDNNDESTSTGESDNAVTTAGAYREGDINAIGTDVSGDLIAADEVGDALTDKAGEPITTAVPVTTDSLAADNDSKPEDTQKNTESASEPAAEPKIDHTQTFRLNGLQFYGSPTSERRKMSSYTQLYEYRTEEPGQPWELIMEYENVPYEGKNCDTVLCFTSLGLVGVNYFDSSIGDYNYWIEKLSSIYGSPDETQYDYTAWSSSPIGSGTMIYVFALEDGVQISFLADDTGSELTK